MNKQHTWMKSKKKTPNFPKIGGKGVEVSKTLFYYLIGKTAPCGAFYSADYSIASSSSVGTKRKEGKGDER